MLAEELSVVDTQSPLWTPLRSLLKEALRLDQQDTSYYWYGWNKQQIETFLQKLPTHCTLVVAVWDTSLEDGEDNEEKEAEQEFICIGWVAEVQEGSIKAIRTLDTFAELPPVQQLALGYEHALEIMRVARLQIAPVAYALFTDKHTWDDWLYTAGQQQDVTDKGALLASFAHQGRCVLMGSEVGHHHPEVKK